MHDRRDRVEKSERGFAGELANLVRERRRGEGAGRDDYAVPLSWWNGYFLAANFDIRMLLDRRRHRRRKSFAVDRERAAGGHLIGVPRAHDERIHPPQFVMQKPDCVHVGIVGAERIRANELRELAGFVRGRAGDRPHFVQHHGNATLGELKRGFRAREAAADDVNGFHPANLDARKRSGKSSSFVILDAAKRRSGIQRRSHEWISGFRVRAFGASRNDCEALFPATRAKNKGPTRGPHLNFAV